MSKVEGVPAMALARDLDALAAARPSEAVRLLPALDQYVLGAGTANPWIVDVSRRGAISRAGGWISPVVLAGGRVAGTCLQDGHALAVELFAERAASVPRDGLTADSGRIGAMTTSVRVV
jgi:hypothetical protein